MTEFPDFHIAKKVLSCSIFKGTFSGHGGEKRSQQLNTLLSVFDHHQVTFPFRYNEAGQASLKNKIGSWSFAGDVLALNRNLKRPGLNILLKKAFEARLVKSRLLKTEQLLKDCDTVIWENNFPQFFLIPYYIKTQFKKKIIACPHNLESLIPMQKAGWIGSSRTEALEEELQALRWCDAVYTISEEEEWALNVLDVRAQYLPYFPIGNLYNELLTLRAFRQAHATRPYFLIVGSVTNPPTKAGMINLLEMLTKIFLAYRDFPYTFKITGYGTESLKHYHSAHIEVLGQTPESVLEGLMKNCRAMIASQGYSSGALTKVTEALVSGIPIILDNGGARSYRRTDGVYVYHSQKQLSDLLFADHGIPPLPEKPEGFFTRFVDSV